MAGTGLYHAHKALLALGLMLAFDASAGTVTDVGPTVRNALEMQRSGRQSVEVRPILEDVAVRTYRRYLESYTYPIPLRFERDLSFAADGR